MPVVNYFKKGYSYYKISTLPREKGLAGMLQEDRFGFLNEKRILKGLREEGYNVHEHNFDPIDREIMVLECKPNLDGRAIGVLNQVGYKIDLLDPKKYKDKLKEYRENAKEAHDRIMTEILVGP